MSIDVDLGHPVAVLSAIAEPTRWRIVQLLRHEELCVCHLVEELAVAQPLVSHHLRVLREARLVETERYRYWTYYRLRPDALVQLGTSISRLASVIPTRGERRRPCC
jgi:ArsR family transcriptional regulator